MNTLRKKSRAHTLHTQAGFSMVEVLVTLIILMVGLLGLAGLMVQSQRSELESYQRVQAIILLQDMVGRINANRNVAVCYAFTTTPSAGTPYVGTTGANLLTAVPTTCAAVTTATALQTTLLGQDITAWQNLLNGAAETFGGNNAGAMVGARGCVSYDATTVLPQLDPTTGLPNGLFLAGTGIYTVSVAWQGTGDTFAPPASLNCGKNLYGAETRRRVVSQTLRIASLT